MISIVIITRNRKAELKKTILSCFRQHSVSEFVVVDNNSSDGTQKYIEELAKEHSFKLKYLFMEENLGVAGARNVGFENSSCEIVFFIDDDAYIDDSPDCISKIEEFMLMHPDIAIVATDIYNIQDNIYQYGIFPKGVSPRTEGEVLYFIGASHFIRKSPFAGGRLYPEKLFFEQEERYASFLAWSLDYKVWYTNLMCVTHAPSSFTRISNKDRALNNYLNAFIIKKLLNPGCLIPIVWILFLTRFSLFSGINIKSWKTCYSRYRERYSDSDRRPMSLKKIIKLIKQFGITPLL